MNPFSEGRAVQAPGQVNVTRVRRNTIGDLLSRSAAHYPHKEALVYHSTRLTYQAFEGAVAATAEILKSAGVGRGSTFAVLSKNSLDFVLLTYALANIGAVLVPINYMLTSNEIAYTLNHADVSGIACASGLLPNMIEAMKLHNAEVSAKYVMDHGTDVDDWLSLATRRSTVEHSSQRNLVQDEHAEGMNIVLDDDPAQILYTSGTESLPKGVVLTHASVIAQYVSCIFDGSMATEDVTIHALPLYHSAQLNCFLGPSVYVGGKGIILEQASPELILKTIEKEKATALFCPPTVWIALLRHPDFTKRDLTSLKKCYYGAAIMPMEILRELSQRLRGASFWNFYGQTEVAPLATILKPEDQMRKLGSAGRPGLNVQTSIMDEDGHIVGPGVVGEIVHRTAHAMKEYLKDPDKTADAFRNGWFHSGDLGVMDEEGYLTIVDRKKDMIKTGGVNVASREVEEVLYQHPAVSEVAVVGVRDEYWIEAVTALVVLKTGYVSAAESVDADLAGQPTELVSSDDLIAFCRGRIASFKVPKRIVFTDALPKNPSGKILKRELRRRLEA